MASARMSSSLSGSHSSIDPTARSYARESWNPRRSAGEHSLFRIRAASRTSSGNRQSGWNEPISYRQLDEPAKCSQRTVRKGCTGPTRTALSYRGPDRLDLQIDVEESHMTSKTMRRTGTVRRTGGSGPKRWADVLDSCSLQLGGPQRCHNAWQLCYTRRSPRLIAARQSAISLYEREYNRVKPKNTGPNRLSSSCFPADSSGPAYSHPL